MTPWKTQCYIEARTFNNLLPLHRYTAWIVFYFLMYRLLCTDEVHLVIVKRSIVSFQPNIRFKHPESKKWLKEISVRIFAVIVDTVAGPKVSAKTYPKFSQNL